MSWIDLPGWFSFPRLYDEFLSTAPYEATIVEVGVAYGRSLMYLAGKAIELGRDDIRIVGIDAWGQSGARLEPSYEGKLFLFGDVMRGMLAHAPRELERVSLWRMTSIEAARALPNDLHAVFIDGDHSYESARSDIAAWKDKSRTLAGHDINFSTVRQAVVEALGAEGVGFRTWQDPMIGKSVALDWQAGANGMEQGVGPCWIRL